MSLFKESYALVLGCVSYHDFRGEVAQHTSGQDLLGQLCHHEWVEGSPHR